MKKIGMTRGVVIAMNPQTGEILAMVSLPTYDNNQFARGHQRGRRTRSCSRTRTSRCSTTRSRRITRPGSTYKLVAGTGAPERPQDHRRRHGSRPRPYLTLGDTKFYEWNRRGWGACNIYCGFGHSSDTFFYQVAGMLGSDRLGYWAKQYGFGEPTGVDLPSEVAGIVPTNAWKQDALGAEMFPGETYQAGHRPGLRRRHAAPAHQRVRRARQRRHALPAADRARDHRARRQGRPPVRAEGPPQDEGQAERAADDAQRRPRDRDSCATPTTSSTSRSRSPASPAPPSSATPTRRAACRTRRSSSGSRRRIPRTVRSTSPTRSSSSWRSRTTRGPTATRRPRS